MPVGVPKRHDEGVAFLPIEALLADRRRFTDGEAYPLIGALIGDRRKG